MLSVMVAMLLLMVSLLTNYALMHVMVTVALERIIILIITESSLMVHVGFSLRTGNTLKVKCLMDSQAEVRQKIPVPPFSTLIASFPLLLVIDMSSL